MDNKLLIQDLAEAIAIKEGLTKKKSEAFIKALFETIEEGLVADKFVKIKGLGTFKIITVGERESVNINTGERFSIEGHEKITFTPDTALKDLVNRPFAHFQTVILNDETDLEELESVDASQEDASVEFSSEEPDNDEDAVDNEVDDEENETESDEKEAEDTENVPDTTVATDTAEKDDLTKEESNNANKVVAPSPTQPESASSPEVTTTTSPETEEDNTTQESIPQEDMVPEETAPEKTAPEKLEERDEQPSTPDREPINQVPLPPTQDTETSTPNNELREAYSPAEDSFEKEKKDSENPEEETLETSQERPAPFDEQDKSPQMSNMKEQNEQDALERAEERKSLNDDSQQDIKYIIKELENKRNTWKTISIVLLSILLLILSYFAGYFRWFCPCEMLNNKESQTLLCPAPDESEKETLQNFSAETQDSTTLESDSIETDTVVTPIEKVDPAPKVKQKVPAKPAPAKKREVVKKESPKEKQQPAAESNPSIDPLESQYNQVPGGRYKIVGTIRTHKIQNGETIRTIALDVYGSKGYAIYIITHNSLENPNMVDTGTILKLPKLEKRKK